MTEPLAPLNDHTPQRVLAVMPHPDDTEFYCGATLATWAARGAEVFIAIVTDGSKGSNDPDMTPERLIVLRQAEQRAATQRLGGRETFFLGFPDGYLQPTLEVRRAITRLIRQVKPDAMVIPDPDVHYYDNYINHPDHRATGEAALYAFQPAANNRFFYPELLDEGLEPHQIKELYLAGAAKPNIEIDVTAGYDARIAALREHHSQFSNMDELEKNLREGEGKVQEDGAKRYTEEFRRFHYT